MYGKRLTILFRVRRTIAAGEQVFITYGRNYYRAGVIYLHAMTATVSVKQSRKEQPIKERPKKWQPKKKQLKKWLATRLLETK